MELFPHEWRWIEYFEKSLQHFYQNIPAQDMYILDAPLEFEIAQQEHYVLQPKNFNETLFLSCEAYENALR